MINFRFHLVSLIAVFLALALGIVVGSTVIDRAIVDGLEAQIDRVERSAERQRRENSELRQRIERLTVFGEQVAPYTTAGRLEGVPVVVLAVRGVDENATRAAVDTIRAAGAVAPAVVWLEPAWSLVDEGAERALTEILALEDAGTDVLRRSAASVLAQRLAAGGFEPGVADTVPDEVLTEEEEETVSDDAEPGQTTAGDDAPDRTDTIPPVPTVVFEDDPILLLAEAGFLTIDRAGGGEFELADYPGVDARVVVIDGPEARVAAAALFLPILEALSDVSILTVAAEVPSSDDDGEDAAVVGLAREDDLLRTRVSTVDHIDTVTGRVALVLTLEELGRDEIGHYGIGPGASRQLPEPVAS